MEEPSEEDVSKLPPHEKRAVLVNVPSPKGNENGLGQVRSSLGGIVHELEIKEKV